MNSRTISFLFTACTPLFVFAADDTIDGVQPASLDQPRVYIHFQRTLKSKLLATDAQPKSKDLLGEEVSGDPVSAVEAFLDTGASGIMISQDTTQKLRIHSEKNATFEDIGVAGSEKFGVSEPLYISTSSYPQDDAESAKFAQPAGPFRGELRGSGGLLEELSGAIDVYGTPGLMGKVIVLDPKGLSQYDKIHTDVLKSGVVGPRTSRHVPLTEVSFANYTHVSPATAAGPTASTNPMIGPDPFHPGDKHAPVVVTLGGKRAPGTFLLDTGAATSMISSAKARELGLTVDESGALSVPKGRKSFQLAVGGLGGTKQSTGIFFDSLSLPTVEGKPIVFAHAPLLVSDVSMVDASGKTFTLDGVFGMNYLVSSAEITGGLVPDIGNIVDGPFKLIVIDLNKQTLGLEPK